jgi:putative ABC transport system substrate-binding protein
MRRRAFVGLLAGAASLVSWPPAARAQQAMPVIGFLNSETPALYAHLAKAFRKGLEDGGFAEGRNVAIEYRWAESRYDRIPGLIADLLQRQVAVLAVNGPVAHAAKAATTTTPIVFFTGNDPVESKLVASLNRPGGNATGASVLNVELTGKRLEVLREVIPKAETFALLINPANSNAKAVAGHMHSAARALGVKVHTLEARNKDELDAAFDRLKSLRPGGLVVSPDGFFNSNTAHLAALTGRYAIPAIFQYTESVHAGGLMSYGASISEAYAQVGIYTGRVLKGERPADLPIVQSAKVELVVNLKTARALGLTVPQTLLGRADEVIE